MTELSMEDVFGSTKAPAEDAPMEILIEGGANSPPKAPKPAEMSMGDVFGGTDQYDQAVADIRSPGYNLKETAKNTGKAVGMATLAAGDLLLGIPGDLAGKLMNVGTRLVALATGESRKVQGQAGALAEDLGVFEGLKTPLQTIAKQLTGVGPADQEIVGKAMDEATRKIEGLTGGLITAEDASLLVGTFMDAGGVVGGHAALKEMGKVRQPTAAEAAKGLTEFQNESPMAPPQEAAPKATTPAAVEVTTPAQVTEMFKAARKNRGSPDEVTAQEAQQISDLFERARARRPPPEITPKGRLPSREPLLVGIPGPEATITPELESAFTKLSRGEAPTLTAEEKVALDDIRKNSPLVDAEGKPLRRDAGAIDPELLKHLAAFSVAAAVSAPGIYQIVKYLKEQEKKREDEDDWYKGRTFKKIAEDALPLGLAAGAFGAVKGKGGMWHPEAIERLRQPLADRLLPPEGNTATTQWTERAIRNYLNKHAGTEGDPLKDIEVPYHEGTKRWEEIWEDAVSHKPALNYKTEPWAEKIPPQENIWGMHRKDAQGAEWVAAAKGQKAIEGYLSHVGDYLRQEVSPEKLPQYDLVRAVKETAKWDAEAAKKMEKAAAEQSAKMPVYKDYGDGFKWVEVKGKTPEETRAALQHEGDSMGHCVAGYCDYVESGDSKIYSLRDAKGKSHVTIEVKPGGRTLGHEMLPTIGKLVDKLRGPMLEEIVQIKGKQNRAPIAEYLPYVQDFVKGGKWGEVGDLRNTGLRDIHEQNEPMRRAAERAYPGQRYLTPEEDLKLKADPKDLDDYINYRIKDRGPNDRQRGSVDPKLLLSIAAVSSGALVGTALSNDKLLAAIIGGVGVGAAAKLSPGRAAQAVRTAFEGDKRIRINQFADTHDAGIARAARAIWQQQRDLVDSAPKDSDRVAITHAIQSNTVGNLPPVLQRAAKKAGEFFSALGEQGKSAGVLRDLIENYVTNLWDLTGKNKDAWEAILNRAGGPSMSPESRFALRRSITSIEEGKRLGLTPVTEDVAQIMGIYGNSLARSIENKKMIGALREATVPGSEQKLLMPSAKAPHSYVIIDHPQMNGIRVHPDIAPSMRFIFDNSSPGAVSAGLQGLNTAIKRSAVSFSLFHAKALTDAFIGAHGMLKGIPMAGKAIAQAISPQLFGENVYLKQLREGGLGDVIDKAQEGGLKFSFEKGKLADEDVGGSFYNGLSLVQKGLDSILPGAGLPVAAVVKLNHLVDTFMWERLHAGMKLNVFANKLEVLREANAKANARDPAKNPLMTEKDLAANAASFTNDIFGGLNWRRIAEEAHTKWGRDIALSAYSPTGRRVMQVLTFAPDWTLSTARAATRTFGGLLGYQEGTGLRGLLEPQNATDLHRQYMLRSAMYYAVVGDGINYALSGHHLWDNKDPTTIDMGDGRTMQWSKHSMEPIHWITKPGQQMLNKLGFLPKEIANQALGTEYLSASGHAPRMDTSVGGRLSHIGRSTLPIAAQQAFGSQATEGSGLAGFLGAPIYGKTNAERAVRKEQLKREARIRRREKERSKQR